MNVGSMMIMIIGGSRLPIMTAIMAATTATMMAMMMPIMLPMMAPTGKNRT